MPDAVRLDREALTTLAHPLRSRLLSALRIEGPATATDLASRLGTNTGATSYHLRRLAVVGLVEDTGAGIGRRRLWAATSRYTSYEPSDFADDPDSAAALEWLQRHHLDRAAEQVQAWLDAAPSWPADWRDAVGLSDDVVTLTATQLQALMSDVDALIRQHRDDGAGDPDARRIAVHLLTAPIDPEDVPR